MISWQRSKTGWAQRRHDGLRCFSSTTQTCWTTILTKSWSRQGNVSSRKNRWMPRVTQTWRRSGGSYLRSGSRPGRALAKIAFWGRRVWRVRRSFSREFAPQRSSWPTPQGAQVRVEETGSGGHFSMESLARWETLVSQEERLQGDVGCTSVKEGLER